MFSYLEDQYYQKLELEEAPYARFMALVESLWNLDHHDLKQVPPETLMVEPQKHMTRLWHKHFPGWVKTVNGWIREEELVQSELRVKRAAEEAIRRREEGE